MWKMRCESDMKEEREREKKKGGIKRINDLEKGMRNGNENGDL